MTSKDANEPDSARRQAPVLILGMHRSGTSCLAGCLENMGLRFGDVNRAAKFNAKGNMEDPEVYRLNNSVLANSGHAWDDPPEAGAIWNEENRQGRDRILARYQAGGERCGWKDPRFLLTLDGWLERIGAPQIIATIRAPAAVANSLVNRGGISFAQSLDLWYAYNVRLLEIARQHDLAGMVVCFDAPEARYLEQVRRAGASIGFDAGAADVTFFETALRQSQSVEWAGIPASHQRLYHALADFL